MKYYKTIFIILWTSMTLSAQEIVQMEYFFDTDPGFGMAEQISVSPDSSIFIETTLSVDMLSNGIHTLYMRVRDTIDTWSFTQKRSFLKDPSLTGQNTDIIALEYFFDTDPGLGNGYSISVTPGADIFFLDNVILDGLSDGLHTIYFRCRDEFENWSISQKRTFLKDPFATGEPTNITEMEYFFDTDPGLGSGHSVEIQDSSFVFVDTLIDINNIDVGVHNLYTRVKNEANYWSVSQKRPFLFDDERIEFSEFKFDSIPSYSNWSPGNPFTPDFDIISDINFEGICDLDTGWYYIDARVRRNLSWWSKEHRDSIEIKNFYLQTGAVFDQFGDSIPDVQISIHDIGSDSTNDAGLYSFLVPKCWGDTIRLHKDSIYSSKNSYVFANPILDYSPHHIVGDIDSALIGYKCINVSGVIPLNQVYVCENTTLITPKTGEIVDTGSISGYILHDGEFTLGTVYEMNVSGSFHNDGTYPQNQKLFISPVVGRPGTPELFDVDHECTDVLLPGKPVVFLNIQDSIYLQLDSTGQAMVVPDTLLVNGCSTCDIEMYSLSQSLFDCADFGYNLEHLTVQDNSGNSSSCPFYVSVSDTIVPTIACRTDTIVHTDPLQCDYTPLAGNMDPITVWDNCPTAQTNSFNNEASLNFADLPLGTHLIQWTTDDLHGNTASCSFEITVEDHEDPVIECTPNFTRSTNPGLCTYTAAENEFDPVSATDNCTDFFFWNDSSLTSTLDGYVFTLGNHLITWIIDDGHGQFDTCYSTITIEDNEPPEIVCASSASRNTDAGICSYTIIGNEFDPISVTDNCFALTFNNDSSFTNTLDGVVLSLGQNTIIWSVDDGHGQTASCALTIDVLDNETPVISCAGAASRQTDSGQCSYMVIGNEFDPLFVSDNCPDYIWTNDYTNSSTLENAILPIGMNVIHWTVDDGHGNSSSCAITVDVEDQEVPTIECPNDITLEIPSSVCDTTYNYFIATNDNCPGETLSLQTGIGSGNPFPEGITMETLQVEDQSGNTAVCSFNITVEKIPDFFTDTICFGDSIFLEGEYQYLPGIFRDTFQNTYACDSITITNLDTTTICIWPSGIIYVDSSATGENTGIDWENAYIDLQLALDISERYQNARQVWVAKATYFPTSGLNRETAFVLVDSTTFLGGFEGIETDSSERDASSNLTFLSGNIGLPEENTDNSYHVLANPATNDNVFLDGFIIRDGYANGPETGDQSGGAISNQGKLHIANCLIENCFSIGLGSLIDNQGISAYLIIENLTTTGTIPNAIWNRDQGEILLKGTVNLQ